MCAAIGVKDVDPSSEQGQAVARAALAPLQRAGTSGHPLITLVAGYVLETHRCFGDG